jgi:hypothetical protein
VTTDHMPGMGLVSQVASGDQLSCGFYEGVTWCRCDGITSVPLRCARGMIWNHHLGILLDCSLVPLATLVKGWRPEATLTQA